MRNTLGNRLRKLVVGHDRDVRFQVDHETLGERNLPEADQPVHSAARCGEVSPFFCMHFSGYPRADRSLSYGELLLKDRYQILVESGIGFPYGHGLQDLYRSAGSKRSDGCGHGDPVIVVRGYGPAGEGLPAGDPKS